MTTQNELISNYEFDGFKFSTMLFMGREAISVKFILAKKILPAVADIVPALIGKNIATTEVKDVGFSQGIETFFKNIESEEEFLTILKKLFSQTKVYIKNSWMFLHEDIALDSVFCGKTEVIYKVIKKILELNYPLFFGKISTLTNFAGPQTRQTDIS